MRNNNIRDISAISLDPGKSHTSQHSVQFYEGEVFLLDTVARFIGDGLSAGDATVVIMTKAHREGLEHRLTGRGLELAALAEQGRYVAMDAAETLSKFMVEEWPSESRFATAVGDVIAHASAHGRHPRVRAFGEMVAVLCAQSRTDAALWLEELWNDLSKRTSLNLFCAYPMDIFRGDPDGTMLRRVCEEHSQVIPTERYTELFSSADRMRSIALLQHKEKVLEGEKLGRRQAEKSLDLRRQELSDFLENAVEGLHQVGPDGTILWANAAQLKLLGYSGDEYVGHRLADLMAPRDRFEEFWRLMMSGEKVYDFPTRLRCKDGSMKHVLIHSSGFWQDGKFLYTRCFIRDVTERVHLASELNRKVEELAEADRRKNEFLAMLGHELRNPLAALSNAVATARLDGTQHDRALDIARRQSDQLARLVDDLLEIARITVGRITLRKEPLFIGTVVERAVEETRFLADSRHHTVSVLSSSETETAQIVADPARLQQVLANLIGNAIKFTPNGGRIEVLTHREADQVVLRVRDYGDGISPELLPRVFEPFTQADVSLDRTQGGLGIGLTLVKRLVEMHDGRVEARSEGLGKGSEFAVWLPVVPSPRTETHGLERLVTKQPRIRVLIVEDNADAADSLSMLLETFGYDAIVTPDGPAALDAARASEFDIALVDIGLPGMDGYEVARLMRMLPNCGNMQLAALTGYGQEEDRQRALAAGFHQHLMKPLKIERLQAILAQLSVAKQG